MMGLTRQAHAIMVSLLVIAGGGLASCITPESASPPPAALVLAIPEPAPDGPDFHPEGRGWSLVWSDEFDGEALDRTKWRPEESCWGGGNDEHQCYTDREANIQVVNGLLRLIAFKEEFTGPNLPPELDDGPPTTRTQPYTSGKVRTRGVADWRYGRFSARIKLPTGQGSWPAFWMMPADDAYGRWPLSGEIDIMEAINLGAVCPDCSGDSGENRTVGALHYGDRPPDNVFIAETNTLEGAASPADGYHVYSVEWGEGRIQWFVDGVMFLTATPDDWFTAAPSAAGADIAPFDRTFYLMLNYAVGGRFPEGANALGLDPDTFPSQVLVDWVRVYQCEPDRETGLECMAEG